MYIHMYMYIYIYIYAHASGHGYLYNTESRYMAYGPFLLVDSTTRDTDQHRVWRFQPIWCASGHPLAHLSEQLGNFQVIVIRLLCWSSVTGLSTAFGQSCSNGPSTKSSTCVSDQFHNSSEQIFEIVYPLVVVAPKGCAPESPDLTNKYYDRITFGQTS